MYDFLIYLLPVAALAITAMQSYRGLGGKAGKYAFSLFLCALYAAFVSFNSGMPIDITLFIMGVAVLAANLIFAYSRLRAVFSLGIVATLLSFAYWYIVAMNVMPFIEAFAVGSFVALILRFGYSQKVNRSDKRLERKRDLFQILIGMIALLSFMLVQQYAYVIVFTLVMIGYVTSGVMLNHRGARFLKSMEREGSFFGAGAIYMAVGTLLILGSINSYPYVVMGLTALLICDAVATVIGTRGRHRLPYNRGKTIEGTLAYFAVLAIVGFLLASYYGLVFAAVLAIVEGLPDSVDDNLAIPIMAIVMYYLL